MPTDSSSFNYERAFYRNIGWFTQTEQQILSEKTVAIAGLGGAGGVHLLTLVRMGIQNFHLAEFDEFEIGNFNRQVGATMSNVGHSKLDVMVKMALDINPNCKITSFPDGINEENIEKFLADVDVYVDGIDFFAIKARRLVFAYCAKLEIPAVTAAPLAMGTGYFIFMPKKMSFEEYFGMEGKTELEQYVRLLVGITPTAAHRSYLVDATRLDLIAKQGPSTMIACNLCSGVAMAEVVKILLKRGKIYAAPYYHLFDAYLNTYKRGYIWGGAKNPIFRLKCFIGNKKIAKLKAIKPVNEQKTYSRPIERILDRTRWAASGENVQNWHFRVLDDNRAEIYVSTIPMDILEELTINKLSLISLGILLETAEIAATALGFSLSHEYRLDISAQEYIITISCNPDSNVTLDPLAPYIEARSVNRFPYQTRPLTTREKDQLSAALGKDFSLEWYEGLAKKLQVARLNAKALDILLRLPQYFNIFSKRIDWENKFSPDRMRIASIPLSKLSRVIMRFVTKKWSRMNFANRYLAGTLAPQLETAIIPGVYCAAHFFIIANNEKYTTGDAESTIEIGRKLQRFWLTATRLGLAMQPAFATMVLRDCYNSRTAISEDKSIPNKISKFVKKLSALRIGKNIPDNHIVFAGRIGTPLSPTVTSRSIRKPLEELIKE